MRGSKALWCVVALMSIASVARTEEKEDGFRVDVAADLFSKYVWRGQNIVDDWVLQPSISAGYKGLTGTIWGNMDLHGDLVDKRDFSEVDYSADYSSTFPGQDVFGYSVGVIYYDFVNMNVPATSEVYGGLSASVPWSPAVRAYYDFDEINGTYVQLSIGHTIEKISEWRSDCHCDLQAGASIGYGTKGYNAGYFGIDEGALNDLTFTAGVPICMGKWTIKPSLGWSMLIDEDIRTVTHDSDNLWGGIGAAYRF